jgi:spermidine synthase
MTSSPLADALPPSFFIEHHPDGLAFYINGDLQFDTADEAIYHEHLVIPAIALATQRFPHTPLRVLICGGGDGLAARDVLRFPAVQEITLVDYSAAVLELARTVFCPYNGGSLATADDAPLGQSRVTVYTQEAFELVAARPDACYHAVICDFTTPTCSEDTAVYSREWFQQVRRVLVPGGVLSVNGVSPNHSSLGFWCLYQTLLAADLPAKPMQIKIPSFRRHGYGDWGFFLASSVAIARTELATLVFPDHLQCLPADNWQQTFELAEAIAAQRHAVNIHTLACPQLLYYLLNPQNPAPLDVEARAEPIDFLDIQEPGTNQIGSLNLLELEAMIQVWLAQLSPSTQANQPCVTPEQLIPAQHYDHSPHMTKAWLGYVKSLLQEIDAHQLLNQLLERTKELPPQLAQELKQLMAKIRTGQPLTAISVHTTELITILAVTLLMANLSAPDAAFAKGSGGSSSSYDANSGGFGWLGFWMTLMGGIWLANLYQKRDD